MAMTSFLPTATSDCSELYGKLENMNVDKKIGKGQFSEVYRAKNIINGEYVALKKIQVSFYLK